MPTSNATPDVQDTNPKAVEGKDAKAAKAKGKGHESGDRRFKTLDMVMKRNQFKADALIEVLHKAQEAFGYLEEDVLLYVARGLKIPVSKVYGVATFYHLFSLKPAGEHTCVVCLGTACYVKGSDKIAAALCEDLGVEMGKTSSDGKVSLVGARCIGACGIAPAVVYDGTVAGKVKTEDALAQIQAWKES